jgi:UDP-N-acetylglucosamine enolpyruvyl transferase
MEQYVIKGGNPLYGEVEIGGAKNAALAILAAAIDLKNTNAQTGSITHAEGEYTIPLRGLNTAIKVTIESDAYTSESFTSADWQGNFIMKVKNI